jgi:threonine/homoserine/homoserine lactone efflux protein
MAVPFLEGLGIGLSLAVPPGPINTLIAQQAAAHGWRRGALAGLAAPVVDTVYLALVLAALPLLSDAGGLLRWMALAGALLMAYLAWMTVRIRPAGAAMPQRTFTQVMLVSLVNPFQLAWWLSAGPAFLADKGAAGVAGFLLGIYGWVLAFSWLVRKGALRWDWFTPALEVVSADLLILFALRLGLAASTGL